MSRIAQEIKTLDTSNLVSDIYNDHNGLSSKITYSDENSPSFSDSDTIGNEVFSFNYENVETLPTTSFNHTLCNDDKTIYYRYIESSSNISLVNIDMLVGNRYQTVLSVDYKKYVTQLDDNGSAISPTLAYDFIRALVDEYQNYIFIERYEFINSASLRIYDIYQKINNVFTLIEEGVVLSGDVDQSRPNTFGTNEINVTIEDLAISEDGIMIWWETSQSGNPNVYVKDLRNNSETRLVSSISSIHPNSFYDNSVKFSEKNGNFKILIRNSNTNFSVYDVEYYLNNSGRFHLINTFTLQQIPIATKKNKNSFYFGYVLNDRYYIVNDQNEVQIEGEGFVLRDISNNGQDAHYERFGFFSHQIGEIEQSSKILHSSEELLVTLDNTLDDLHYYDKINLGRSSTINNQEVIVNNPTTIGQIPNYSNSRDLFFKVIPISVSSPTFLRFSLDFQRSDSITNRNYVTTGQLVQSLNEYTEVNIENYLRFRIRTNSGNVLYETENYVGFVNVQVPAGTNEVYLETYDPNQHKYSKYNKPELKISNIRVYDYTEPSIGILNNTNFQDEYTYSTVEEMIALDVEEVGENGFYDIILDSQEKEYIIVGDKYHNINYRPLNMNRNICLKFPVLDYSTVDNDYPIELLVDFVGLDTDYATDFYDDFGLKENEVDEFYKNGGKIGVRALVSTGAFPEDVQDVSRGSNGVYATPYSVEEFKCGLNVYNITEAVKSSILAGKSDITVWLTYDKLYERDEYINFKMGIQPFNKPRIRYRIKNE